MSNVPPPIRNQPSPSPLVRYVWLITALVGLGIIAGIIFVMTSMRAAVENENPGVPVSPLLPKKKNLSKIVKHNPDGWFEVEIADFPLQITLPGRPSRTPMSRSFMPDESWTTDYNAYQIIAQGIAVSVTGYWLNDEGKRLFAPGGIMEDHADAIAKGRGGRLTVKKALPQVTGRTYTFQNGPVTNHVAMVKFMQRPDLMVGVSVSARTMPEAKAKLDKVLANLKLIAK